MARRYFLPSLTMFALLSLPGSVHAQPVEGNAPDRWITVTEGAAGTDAKAKDLAVNTALRKAVEQACGVFLTSESKSKNYKGNERLFR